MGVWDTVRSWFKSEADELVDAKQDLEVRLDQDLTRRERQLDETPAETMERLEREAADDSSFSAISDKIDATAARAAAAAKAEADAGSPAEIDPDFLDGSQRLDGSET